MASLKFGDVQAMKFIAFLAISACISTTALGRPISPGTPEACRFIANKLTLEYEVVTYGVRAPDKVKNQSFQADMKAKAAYGWNKKQMDDIWPGLYLWSVRTLLDGFETLPKAEDFRAAAEVSCNRSIAF